jgi:uncharacterized integral membrane protein (TIGR02327 family)
MEEVYFSMGMRGLLSAAVMLFSVYLAWVVLQELKLDVFLKQPKGRRAVMLRLMLAVAIGYLFSRFILDYWEWSSSLRLLVE